MAGVIVFLLWLWITSAALLFGAQLDAELERAVSSSPYGLKEVLIAATLQGAICSLVKTLIDRGVARAFQRWTGVWPGD